MERLDYAEKVQNFIPTLDWEICPANVLAVAEVREWEAMRMGPVNKNIPGTVRVFFCSSFND